MKRIVRVALVLSVAVILIISRGASGDSAAVATPFSDVPANHWAYQALQSLAADGLVTGYPDGKFKGDRPLTRFEMATVVARVIAKLQENTGAKGPSKEDLDKLQKLIDSLKDELDSLGVRVTNLEDSLDALDKRTKFAQSLAMHGVFLPNVTYRQRPTIPRTVTNTTSAPVTTYYGTAVPCSPGVNGCAANANATAVGGIDPFVNAFETSDDTNNPLTQASSSIAIRQDSRFSLAYQITDGLTVSLPVHLLAYSYGGEYGTQNRIDFTPGVEVTIAKAGAISNLHLKFGIIDTMTSSRTGLAFRAPQGYNGVVPYVFPGQPFQKGVAASGTIAEGAFGTTDVEASFTRVDQTLINTQPGNTDPNIVNFNADPYFSPIVVQQAGFVQTGAAGALRTDTFDTGTGPLAQVFLSQKAVNGSVYVSAYGAATYNALGVQTGGPTTPLPAIVYNDAYNSVVFSTPLSAGTTVAITYRGLTETNNANFQRYMVHSRLNQKFKGLPGAEIGLTFNRIFDFDDTQTSGDGNTGITLVNQAPVTGYGAVSDTVLGLDFQLPVPYEVYGKGSFPVLFGEVASSKFTPDFRNVGAVADTAADIGLRIKINKVEFSSQYQSIGSNFLDGAPFKYYGNPPPLFAFYKLPYLPDFFGFGNNVTINGQFDGQFATTTLPSPNTLGNPNLTFAFPLFNTLKATGPQFFSAYAPNSQGLTTSVNAPIRAGDLTFTTRASYQHLEEIRPNSLGSLLYGPYYTTSVRQRFDTYSGGTSVVVPLFGQNATIGISGAYETLKRLDSTAFPYYPINPGTQTFDGGAFASAKAIGGTTVSFFPNFINMRHTTLGANIALPLTKDVVGSASYSTQHYKGAYGTTTGDNISEHKDYYTGTVTYNIPNTNSSFSVQARHYSYSDDYLPNVNLGENRQDINFTVRF